MNTDPMPQPGFTPTPADEVYLRRALHLARLGGTAVQPNPQVGAVLVAGGVIVAEGWHQRYGGPHAEVEALAQVSDPDLLRRSTLYVSLEPCCHTRKQTPPCTELILAKGIRRVVVGCLDPNPEVSGGGVARLRSQGVQVDVWPDPTPYHDILRPFAVNQLQHRPYIILKWAETADGFIGHSSGQRLHISGPHAQTFGHSLRARCRYILVGGRTARADLPRLDNRLAPGPSPHRLIITQSGTLPALPPNPAGTTVIGPGTKAQLADNDYNYWAIPPELQGMPLPELLSWLWAEHRVATLMIEGGRHLLQQMLDAGVWDEAYRLVSRQITGGDVAAPLPQAHTVWHLERETLHDLIFSNFAPNPCPLPLPPQPTQ